MTTSVNYLLNSNPVYQKSPMIKQLSVIGIASYKDDAGRYPVIIEYQVNEDMNEATIHSHKCPPAEYDFLLEDIYSAVFSDLKANGYNHTNIKDYTL